MDCEHIKMLSVRHIVSLDWYSVATFFKVRNVKKFVAILINYIE